MRYAVQFTSRKRDSVTGDRNQWRHGPYRELAAAETHAAKMRLIMAREIRVDVVPYGAKGPTHPEATKAGIDRARGAGKHVGRPKATLDVARARALVRAGEKAHGRTEALRRAARWLGVSVSTIERALRAPKCPSKGVGSNLSACPGREAVASPVACTRGLRRIWCGTYGKVPLLWKPEVLVRCEGRPARNLRRAAERRSTTAL